jgi:hypothetical protein
MPRVGLEPTTPALGRAKTVHVLDSADTVIGRVKTDKHKITNRYLWYMVLTEKLRLLGGKKKNPCFSVGRRFSTVLKKIPQMDYISR